MVQLYFCQSTILRSVVTVIATVPQGSTLGPLLFLRLSQRPNDKFNNEMRLFKNEL